MTIYGIGTDLTNTSRISKLVKKKSFINRMFSEREIQKCERVLKSTSCYAKRFAAKEAFAKAIGVGIAKGISFKEISVYNIKSGKPKITISGKTKKIVEKTLKTKKFKVFLTLSDDKPFGIATVVISK